MRHYSSYWHQEWGIIPSTNRSVSDYKVVFTIGSEYGNTSISTVLSQVRFTFVLAAHFKRDTLIKQAWWSSMNFVLGMKLTSIPIIVLGFSAVWVPDLEEL